MYLDKTGEKTNTFIIIHIYNNVKCKCNVLQYYVILFYDLRVLYSYKRLYSNLYIFFLNLGLTHKVYDRKSGRLNGPILWKDDSNLIKVSNFLLVL